jgi:nitrate reductase delta subunit
LATAWQAASLLLDYPNDSLPSTLEVVADACTELPADLATPLRSAVSALSPVPVGELQRRYVETFDTQRRGSLYLSYFSYGDTRKRGMALLRFKQTYLRKGFLLDDSELPDHLGVVLEFGATVDTDLGWALLLDHRAGVEVLRMFLIGHGSPWAPALEAISATLPLLRGDEAEAVRRLAQEGPPDEEVGLSPYGIDPTMDFTLSTREPV